MKRRHIVTIGLSLSLFSVPGGVLAQQTAAPIITGNVNGRCVAGANAGDSTITCGDLRPAPGLTVITLAGVEKGPAPVEVVPRRLRRQRLSPPPLTNRRRSTNPRRRPRSPARPIWTRTTTRTRWRSRRGSTLTTSIPTGMAWRTGMKSISMAPIQPSSIPTGMGSPMVASFDRWTVLTRPGRLRRRQQQRDHRGGCRGGECAAPRCPAMIAIVIASRTPTKPRRNRPDQPGQPTAMGTTTATR